MKRKTMILLLVMACITILCGCGGGNFKFDISTVGDKTTVKINKAADGDVCETASSIVVGLNQKAVITSELKSGELKLEIVEAFTIVNDTGPDDLHTGDVVATVTLKADTKTEVNLADGEYVLWITSVGETSGTATINIEKR